LECRIHSVTPRQPWGGLAGVSSKEAADVAILGLPYDGAASWRKGSAEAPARLREISSSSPAISEEGEVVDPEVFRVLDLGDIAPGDRTTGPEAEGARERYFEEVERSVRKTLGASREGTFLLGLGGDHSISIPLIRGFAAGLSGPFGLVLLDAHPDLFDVYDGSRISSACPMRRALETGRLAPEHLLILGTRSYNTVELDLMRERGIRFVPAREIDRRGVDSVVALAGERLADVQQVYLSLDIDVADPSCAPGTGAPVAGGLSSRQTLDLVRGLMEALPVRAMDMVEIAPALDPTNATLFLGLQIVFESFVALARRPASS
jgi:agmatinase